MDHGFVCGFISDKCFNYLLISVRTEKDHLFEGLDIPFATILTNSQKVESIKVLGV